MKETAERRAERYKRILEENDRLKIPADGFHLAGGNALPAAAKLVLAPVLADFVLWLLRHALADGIRRLYFLARDGYFMYHASRFLREKFELPIECRYLSCSRFSLRVPMFHLDRQAALDYICRGGIDVTIERILTRAGLNIGEQQKVLEKLPFSFQSGKILTQREREEFRRFLEGCKEFSEAADARSRRAMPDTAGYLKQEGLLEENVPSAVVDSGWMGSMQETLNLLLFQLGRKKKLSGYYWGLYDFPLKAAGEHYRCYFFTPARGLKEKIFFNNCLFEVVFSAPHGMTMCYRREGERFLPCYGNIDEKKKGFLYQEEEIFRQYMGMFAQTLKKDSFFEEEQFDGRKTIKKLLRLFMARPAWEEAEGLGTLPFSDDVLDDCERILAPLLTERNLKEGHLPHQLFVHLGFQNPGAGGTAWYEGSVVRTGKKVEWHLFHYRCYQLFRYWKKQIKFRRERGG